MILFRAINKYDLENYKSGDDIHCTLYNSFNNKEMKRSRNVDEYYRLCLEKNRGCALDCIVGHVSGKRLSVNVSPWISTTTLLDFTLREYAIPQAGDYNHFKERKPVILIDFPDEKVLSTNEEISKIRSSITFDNFAIDLRNNNLNLLYNNAIYSEKYNEDMPGYDVCADCNRILNGKVTNVNGFSNFATATNEVLIFSKIKREDIRLIIYPLLQDILYSCGIDEHSIDLITLLESYTYNKVDILFSELYPSSIVSTNLTDYLIRYYSEIPGDSIESKYRYLKKLKLELLKKVAEDINSNFGTKLEPTRVIDDNVFVSSYQNINQFSKKQTNDILIIEKDGMLYSYDNGTRTYISDEDDTISKSMVLSLIGNK